MAGAVAVADEHGDVAGDALGTILRIANVTGQPANVFDIVEASPTATVGGQANAGYQGLFTNRKPVSMSQLTTRDGSSNTLMFGEGLGGTSPGARDFQWSWMGVGAMATFQGIQDGQTVTNGGTTSVANPSWSSFNSAHGGIVHFCFADGSVRALRPGNSPQRNPTTAGSDWYVYQMLAGMRDGSTWDSSSLLLN